MPDFVRRCFIELPPVRLFLHLVSCAFNRHHVARGEALEANNGPVAGVARLTFAAPNPIWKALARPIIYAKKETQV